MRKLDICIIIWTSRLGPLHYFHNTDTVSAALLPTKQSNTLVDFGQQTKTWIALGGVQILGTAAVTTTEVTAECDRSRGTLRMLKQQKVLHNWSPFTIWTELTLSNSGMVIFHKLLVSTFKTCLWQWTPIRVPRWTLKSMWTWSVFLSSEQGQLRLRWCRLSIGMMQVQSLAWQQPPFVYEMWLALKSFKGSETSGKVLPK